MSCCLSTSSFLESFLYISSVRCQKKSFNVVDTVWDSFLNTVYKYLPLSSLPLLASTIYLILAIFNIEYFSYQLRSGIGHMIDYRRTNVAIEAFYILVPLFVSLIVMILMACHYGIGAAYMPSGFVATAVSTFFYQQPNRYLPSNINFSDR